MFLTKRHRAKKVNKVIEPEFTYNMWYGAFLKELKKFPLCVEVRLNAEFLRDLEKCKGCPNFCLDEEFMEFYSLSRRFDRICGEIALLRYDVEFGKLSADFKAVFLGVIHSLFKLNWGKIYV